MGHMQPEVIGPLDWWECETSQGTFWVKCEDAGHSDILSGHLLPFLPVDAAQLFRWELFKDGYGCRLSAPGYLDCTDWTVFDSEEGARECLVEQYGLCQICLSDNWHEDTCMDCVDKMSHDDLHAGLVEYICENVTTSELVSQYWNSMSEDYNNEMLDQAYKLKLEEYLKKPCKYCNRKHDDVIACPEYKEAMENGKAI